MRENQQIKANKLRIISVTGGKGGVGKTTLSVNLAITFAKMGKKVLLLDGDLGLANVDIMLGIQTKKSLHDVLLGKHQLSEICVTGPHGVKIIPASSGIQKMADLTPQEYTGLIQSFSTLVDDIDIMIVDTAAGISNQVIDFTNASQDIVVVICNDPSSLLDSYAVIKILHQKYGRDRFGVIVNKVKSQQEAVDVFSRFQNAAENFIDVSLNFLGHVPGDDYVKFAARESVSFVDRYPHSPAVSSLKAIAKQIACWQDDTLIAGGIQFFFEKLVQSQ